jgi:SPP1 gp7 family putative phage head morphogenesis protein
MDNNIDLTGQKQPKHNPGGTPVSVVRQHLEIRPFNRAELDINVWRSALKSAEGLIRYRVKLYDIYHELVDDGHVQAVMGKRKDPVTTANFQFVNKDGEPVEAINQLMDSIGFEEMLEEIVEVRGWGYSMMEPGFYKNSDGEWEMSLYVVPKYLMRPHLGIIAKNAYSDEGLYIRKGIYAKTIMEVGKPDDIGLYNKAVPYYIYKRGALGDFAMFIQVFGQPLIDAEWDGVNEEQRIRLSEALNEIGSGGAIVRPAGTKVDLKDKSSTANGDLQDKFINIMNREISKALLGSTETTEASQSSGYAQSKTHENQDDRKHESDIKFARRILNSRFIPILKAAGFDTQGGSFIIQGEEDALTKKESFEIHKGLAMEVKLPIDDDFWYETYGVPKPDNYKELKAASTSAKATADKQEATEDPPSRKASEGKEELEEKQVSLSLLERVKSFFVEALPVNEAGRAMKQTNCGGEHHTIKLAVPVGFDDDELIRRHYDAAGKSSFDDRLYFYFADTLLKGFKKGWDKDFIALADAPGFTYGEDDPALLTAFEQNIFRFSAAKTLAEVQELNSLFRESSSFNDFYRKAKERTEVFNKAWMETEYNTAILTGEAAATYHRLLAQVEIFPYWEYRTVADDHVRREHQLLHGLILPANDPRWNKIFPPNGWNCRCWIVPRMAGEVDKSKLKEMRARADDYFKSTEYKKNAAMGWGVNRGKTGEIFTANQQYVTKQPGMAAKLINQLQAADYGMKQYSQARKSATENVPVYTDDASSFYKSLEIVEGKAVVRDYHKRPLEVDVENFERHTTGTKADRIKYLMALKKAMEKPDEVWINGEQLEDIIYLKYYQDKTMVVVGDVRKSNASAVSSWFTLHEKKEVIKKYRRGILIKK